MKRILLIAILISYSITSFGVSINYFYCCGKLKTVSLATNKKESNGQIKSNKGCCQNKTVTLKLKTDQKSNGQSNFHFAISLSPFTLHTDKFAGINPVANGSINPLYKRPPPGIFPSRNVLYCVFRI